MSQTKTVSGRRSGEREPKGMPHSPQYFAAGGHLNPHRGQSFSERIERPAAEDLGFTRLIFPPAPIGSRPFRERLRGVQKLR
jgi:hypothetical protein